MKYGPVSIATPSKKHAGRRAIVLFGLEQGKVGEALRRLSLIPGIAETGSLDEGPPDLLVITEAPTRYQLVRGTLTAIAALEDVTLSVCCLVVRAGTLRGKRKDAPTPRAA